MIMYCEYEYTTVYSIYRYSTVCEMFLVEMCTIKYLFDRPCAVWPCGVCGAGPRRLGGERPSFRGRARHSRTFPPRVQFVHLVINGNQPASTHSTSESVMYINVLISGGASSRRIRSLSLHDGGATARRLARDLRRDVQAQLLL